VCSSTIGFSPTATTVLLNCYYQKGCDMKKIMLYVAGPFRATCEWLVAGNVRRAGEVALEAWGYSTKDARVGVLCPHLNTAQFNGALPDDSIWLEGDLLMMERCDALILTPDWAISSGAIAEYNHARDMKMPVFFAEYDKLGQIFISGLCNFINNFS
jgi:hypothetical protein